MECLLHPGFCWLTSQMLSWLNRQTPKAMFQNLMESFPGGVEVKIIGSIWTVLHFIEILVVYKLGQTNFLNIDFQL